jgi:hypothetical protein
MCGVRAAEQMKFFQQQLLRNDVEVIGRNQAIGIQENKVMPAGNSRGGIAGGLYRQSRFV